ncbi:MAG: glycosyltransferase family 39 protein [Candidatus Riflebacteria bacterium]|nr:glycosyltransferase family 39 protein [Candidatus Riflebacteria bacterium]
MDEEFFRFSKKFLLISLVFTAYKLFLGFSLDLTPDEAYYWEFSRRLDLSFYDHPPMVGYMIFLGRLLFGDTAIGVRIFTILITCFVGYLIYILGKRLSGEWTGLVACTIFHTSAAGVALGFIMTPDTPLAFFWTLGTILFLKTLDSKTTNWWILLGIVVGLGGLSKYNMVFFGFGAILVLICFGEFREKGFPKNFALAILFALLFVSPVFIWNAQNDWVSFKFQLHHGFKPSDRSFLQNIGEFLGGQLVTVGPVVFFIAVFQILNALITGFRKNDRFLFSLGALAFPILFFFFYSGLSSKVEANWPQMAYITAIPLVADWICRAPWSWKRILGSILPTSIIGLLASFHAITLILPIAPDCDISARLHGWKEMGEEIQKIDKKLDGKPIFVVQGNTLAALTGFYGKIPFDRIVEVNLKNSWQFWCRDFQLPPKSNAVYVDDNQWSAWQEYSGFFEKTLASVSVNISFSDKKLRTINLTPLINHKGGFQPKKL